MAHDEPIIVVLGTIGGGTSAVASVLHHLGVFMGTEFGASYRELQQNWEDAEIGQLCRRAINAQSGQLQMEPHLFQEKLRIWADGHRRAARAAGRARASSTPCCALRSICSMAPGARSCRWWWTGHSPRYWRL